MRGEEKDLEPGSKGVVESRVGSIARRYGVAPGELLVDGGYVSLAGIESLEEEGCRIYAPPMRPRDPGRDPYPGDGPGVARWRRRMGAPGGRAKYRSRAEAECIHAQARNRGLHQMPVRGRLRVRCVLLFHALAENFMRTIALHERTSEMPA